MIFYHFLVVETFFDHKLMAPMPSILNVNGISIRIFITFQDVIKILFFS